MSHRNTLNWPFPEETETPSLESADDECHDPTISIAHTETEIIRPDYRNRASVARVISPCMSNFEEKNEQHRPLTF